jgi:UPF0755 protein
VFYIYKRSVVPADVVVYLPAGADYNTIRDSVIATGKVSDGRAFEAMARIMKLPESVKPGRYRLNKGMNARRAVALLRSGNQSPVRLTFNNIHTLDQLAGRLAAQIAADSVELVQWLLSDTVAARYDFKPEEFLGMFIPDTYEVYWTVSPRGLTDRMKREYDAFWNEARLAKLARTRLTQKEVATLASIIEQETLVRDEMPLMAGVYINRLHTGMLLQADPTVKFAVGDRTIRRVLNRHLLTDSPYNTYRNAGLPPGPISMPSRHGLDAVLNYTEHNYLYFCAKDDFSGRHSFARTYSEHLKNAAAYSRALDRAGIR